MLHSHQGVCTAGRATSVKGRRRLGGDEEVPVTQISNMCGAKSWAVGYRLPGETELCLLYAPSQQEEEPVPQAGGQTQDAFEDNAGHCTFAAVSPTAFRSHPDLIKLASRRKCPCQINYETKLAATGT